VAGGGKRLRRGVRREFGILGKKNDASKYVGKMSKRSSRRREKDGCGSNPEAIPLENTGAGLSGRSGIDCEIFREITQVHSSTGVSLFSHLLAQTLDVTFPSRALLE
jgi:hypothetical protein